jgi:hypothetical protein
MIPCHCDILHPNCSPGASGSFECMFCSRYFRILASVLIFRITILCSWRRTHFDLCCGGDCLRTVYFIFVTIKVGEFSVETSFKSWNVLLRLYLYFRSCGLDVCLVCNRDKGEKIKEKSKAQPWKKYFMYKHTALYNNDILMYSQFICVCVCVCVRARARTIDGNSWFFSFV